MINLKNTLILAGTKLKTRKIRLIITVIISSLMFGVLTVGIIAFTGFTSSVERFSKEGLNNRFFVQLGSFSDGYSYVDYHDYFAKPETLERAKQIANEMVEVRAKRAKELGLDFDKKAEFAKLLPEASWTAKEKEAGMINPDGVVGKKLFEEYSATKKVDPQLVPNLENIERITEGYDVVQKFQTPTQSLNNGNGTFGVPSKDDSYPILSASEAAKVAKEGEKEIINYVTLTPESIVAPFRLSEANWSVESNSVPIFVSFSQAKKLLGLKDLPSGSSVEDAVRFQAELQDKVAGLKISYCYRNDLATEQLQQAKQHELQKGTKDYINPELIYGLPEGDKCAIAPILIDKRSAEDKKREAAQHQFDVEFNNKTAAPIAKEVVFQVVGVIPSSEDSWTGHLASRLISVAITPPSLPNAVPEKDFQLAVKHLGLESVFYQANSDPTFNDTATWFVEFTNLKDAKMFMEKRDCSREIYKAQADLMGDGRLACPAERPFMVMPAMNGRLMLESAIEAFTKMVLIAVAVIVVIATIIMAGTVGRMIADSRRETAVFRAIGFKRLDISRVYSFYTLIICLLIVVFSLAIGYIGATVIAGLIDKDLTMQAILATGTTNHDLKMTLIGFSPLYSGALVLAILIVGFLAIIIPLIRNLRRNPIKDMRDE